MSESTRPLVKNDNMQRINVTISMNRDNWSKPYLPYMKLENLSLKLMIKTPFKKKTTYKIEITNSQKENQYFKIRFYTYVTKVYKYSIFTFKSL